MKKTIIKLLLILSILIIPKAYATSQLLKTCTYTYFSEVYGLSTAKVKLYEAKSDLDDSLYIDRFNGEELDDKDLPINLKIRKSGAGSYDNKWFEDFTAGSHQGVCPYFLLLDINGSNEGMLAYDVKDFDIWEDYNGKYRPDAEVHVLLSDTIQDDMSGYRYEDYQDMQQYDGFQHDPYPNKDAAMTCVYNLYSDGFNSAIFRVYTDGTYSNTVVLFNGDTGTSYSYNPWQTWKNSGLPDADKWIKIVINEQRCPYYMGVDRRKVNQWMLADVRTDISNNDDFKTGADSAHILVSRNIAEQKPDYDPSKDGTYRTLETEIVKAWSGSAKVPDISDWDPDDPYGFHIGDKFCREKNTVNALKSIGRVIMVAKFAIPIIIMIRAIIDFFLAVVEGEPSYLKKKAISLVYRFISGVFIFFIPTLTNAAFNGLSYYNVISDDIDECQSCLLNPTNPDYCLVGFYAEVSEKIDENRKKTTKSLDITTISHATTNKISTTTANSGGGSISSMEANNTYTNNNTPVGLGTYSGSCEHKTVFSKISASNARNELTQLLSKAKNGREKAVVAANYLATNFPNLPYHWGGYTSATIDNNWGSCVKTSTASGHSTAGTLQPYGMDCSGFVSWVMTQAGYKNGHQASGFWGEVVSNKKEISGKNSADLVNMGVKVGDLVWHSGHIGIIIGRDSNGFIIAHEKGFNNSDPKKNGLVKEYLDNNIKGCGKSNSSNFTHVLLMDGYYK